MTHLMHWLKMLLIIYKHHICKGKIFSMFLCPFSWTSKAKENIGPSGVHALPCSWANAVAVMNGLFFLSLPLCKALAHSPSRGCHIRSPLGNKLKGPTIPPHYLCEEKVYYICKSFFRLRQTAVSGSLKLYLLLDLSFGKAKQLYLVIN